MKKLKIYLDTSVISHLDAPDRADREADTRKLWKDIKAGLYDIVLSDLTMIEINDCPEPKRSFMRNSIAEIQYGEAMKDEAAERLSALYVEFGGLPPKSRDDALHIAIATISDCDIILSWNFRHIVKLRAITAVEAVNTKEGYAVPRIMSPSMILNEEE